MTPPEYIDAAFPELEDLGDHELARDTEPDESVVDREHPVPTEQELADGQRLGEDIDTDDDEDTGVEEADELWPEDQPSPYAGVGPVFQDVQDADELE